MTRLAGAATIGTAVKPCLSPSCAFGHQCNQHTGVTAATVAALAHWPSPFQFSSALLATSRGLGGRRDYFFLLLASPAAASSFFFCFSSLSLESLESLSFFCLSFLALSEGLLSP